MERLRLRRLERQEIERVKLGPIARQALSDALRWHVDDAVSEAEFHRRLEQWLPAMRKLPLLERFAFSWEIFRTYAPRVGYQGTWSEWVAYVSPRASVQA